LIENVPCNVLENESEGMQLEILKNRLALQKRKPTGCRYGDNIKKFDFTFKYHAPKAYEF